MNLSMVPYSKQVIMLGERGDQDHNKTSANEVITDIIRPVAEEINCNDRRFGVMNLAEPTVVIKPVLTSNITNNNHKKHHHHHHSSKFQVKYKECMKNHAASIGGHANDGCGEFMQEAEAEAEDDNNNNARALRCAACGCHRNFHRKEIHGSGFADHLQQKQQPIVNYNGRYDQKTKNKSQHQSRGGFNSISSLSLPPDQVDNNQQFLVQHRSSKNNSPVENSTRDGLSGDNANEDRRSETPEETGLMRNNGGNSSSNKRFRTKFSQEQRDKMLDFAEKIGWRIQKQDDSALNQFCLEIGVKRQVFKVWMHNNKNSLRKSQLLGLTSSSSVAAVALPTSSSAAAVPVIIMQLQSPPSSSSPAAQHQYHHPRSINGV